MIPNTAIVPTANASRMILASSRYIIVDSNVLRRACRISPPRYRPPRKGRQKGPGPQPIHHRRFERLEARLEHLLAVLEALLESGEAVLGASLEWIDAHPSISEATPKYRYQ